MTKQSANKKMRGKDLITIGIFSAIYFVINFAFMLMGGFHPILWILMPGFIAVFAGIPFMLMTAKVQKLGAVFFDGAHHCAHLLCYWSVYACDIDLDGVCLHFGRSRSGAYGI